MNPARETTHISATADNDVGVVAIVADAMTSARAAQARWLLTPLVRRLKLVRELRRLIAEHAAQLAEAETVPVRIVHLTDAEALEAQLIENLQRRDVHPLEEAQGFKALLSLQEPTYSIEQIAAKVGKTPTRPTGTGSCQLLPRRMERSREQAEARPASRSASPALD